LRKVYFKKSFTVEGNAPMEFQKMSPVSSEGTWKREQAYEKRKEPSPKPDVSNPNQPEIVDPKADKPEQNVPKPIKSQF
jgi:hypothetical protein